MSWLCRAKIAYPFVFPMLKAGVFRGNVVHLHTFKYLSTMKIGIISAMDSEHRQLADRLQQKKESGEGRFRYVEGRLGQNDVVLTQCGIGKVNAAVGAAELIRRHRPDCIISTGVAGGIDTVLRVGDVVASDRLVYHDVYCGNDGTQYGQIQGMPLYYEADSSLLRHALDLNNSASLESRIHGGLICTGDRFVEAADELATIKGHFPQGLAVDMESAAIAQTCYIYGVPFLSFRIISDTPGAHDNNFAQYKDFWATMAERSFQTTWAFLKGVKG